MRVLYLDCDTLRPDHLGCYGYHRDTSPNIDRLAREGLRCTNYYASDAPCLPSRAALFLGRFGIHTGVVNHGGTTADPRLEGATRGFQQSRAEASWMQAMRQAGLYTVSISPYAERHSAWWFYRGFNEAHNTGKWGMERADEIAPVAIDWIQRNGSRDNWFLQVNMWDPHTPFRTPLAYGNPFEGEPIPDWITEEKIKQDYAGYGPHCAQDPAGFGPNDTERWPRLPAEITSLEDYRKWIDGYDIGIRYMDDHIGLILDALAEQGVLDDTVIIVSADHGENQGELNIYGDHQTADQITSRVPLIVRWPGLEGGRVDDALHYNLDLPPTLAEMLGIDAPARWDGRSFAATLREGAPAGRDYLVLSQCTWSCQRAVRWDEWILIRTYHTGLKDFPPVMLFNLAEDPHELHDLAAARLEIVQAGLARLEEWQAEMLAGLEEWQAEMLAGSPEAADPLWTVMQEGGPYHARGWLLSYCERLRATGRGHHADRLLAQRQPNEWVYPDRPGDWKAVLGE
jgi:arylsulfatase A-like enzyme